MSIKHQLKRSIHQMLERNKDGSYASQADRKRILNRFAEDLVKLGYKLPHINGLKNKHILVVVEKWQKDQLSNATLKNQTSALRFLAEKINKSNIVPSNDDLGIASRSYIPKANRAIFDPDFSKISNDYVYASLQLEPVFGLRRKEALLIHPHEADKGTSLMLESFLVQRGTRTFYSSSNSRTAAMAGSCQSTCRKRLFTYSSWNIVQKTSQRV
jgi:hypothetical protein